MQIYKIRQIKSLRDKRTLEFFIKQNPGNRWLTLEDAARHTYETNKPQPWQIKSVQNFLFSICKREFSDNPDAVLEYTTEEQQNRWSYRLIDAGMAKCKDVKAKSTQSMMNEIIVRHDARLETTEKRDSIQRNQQKYC